MLRSHSSIRSLLTTLRFVPLVLLLAFLPTVPWAAPPSSEGSQQPSAEDLTHIRKQIGEARQALKKLAALAVPEQDRKELERRVKVAEEALSRYERLLERGQSRKRAQGSLLAVGGVVLADDATGIGAIDDVLLPVLALGILATQIITHGPATASELDKGLQELTATMMAASEEATRIIKKAAVRPLSIPDRKRCQEHYERCQETYLGKPNSAGRGISICKACWDICKQHGWPDALASGKPCNWWSEDWWNSLPHEGQPQRNNP